jgi:hypothetical protein
MADETQKQTFSLEELMVSTLAMTDALAKVLIAKGASLLTKSSKLSWGPSERIISPC